MKKVENESSFKWGRRRVHVPYHSIAALEQAWQRQSLSSDALIYSVAQMGFRTLSEFVKGMLVLDHETASVLRAKTWLRNEIHTAFGTLDGRKIRLVIRRVEAQWLRILVSEFLVKADRSGREELFSKLYLYHARYDRVD